jgi:hypothetical protein
MLLTAMLSILYLAIAGFAALMSYLERCDKGEHNLMYTTLGFTACALWPLTLLTVIVALMIRPTTSTS